MRTLWSCCTRGSRCRSSSASSAIRICQRLAHLQGIDSEEIISTVHARRAPMMHASAGLAL
jgi:hypothetical protein